MFESLDSQPSPTSVDIGVFYAHPMPKRLLFVVVLPLVAAAGGTSDSNTTSLPSTSTTETSSELGNSRGVLLTGSIDVPAAAAFEDPGFHEPFQLTGMVPADGAGVSGRLVVRLRDEGRPDQACDRDHPLSGCMTVDWSDFEDRPQCHPAGCSTTTSQSSRPTARSSCSSRNQEHWRPPPTSSPPPDPTRQ